MTPLSRWSIKDRIFGVIMIACYAYGLIVLVLR